ncbi:hypothetical protein TBCG_00733 [Mycobacterium tuberculosis C]|nr:hypothetical protein TBCG_00733 [Mycobacterium tuberculosis C]
MTRQQLAHLLRRACAVVGDVDVLVLGSQSILGSFDENELPPQATASQEADIAFVNDPARDKADHVDVAIGEMSDFHRSNGVYAEGVHIDTAILPNGWRDRLVSWTVESSRPAKPRFLEPHDLAVAKLAAGREKDKAFVAALIRSGLLDVGVIQARVLLLPEETDPRIGQRIAGLAELLRCGQPLLPSTCRRSPALHAAGCRGCSTCWSSGKCCDVQQACHRYSAWVNCPPSSRPVPGIRSLMLGQQGPGGLGGAWARRERWSASSAR